MKQLLGIPWIQKKDKFSTNQNCILTLQIFYLISFDFQYYFLESGSALTSAINGLYTKIRHIYAYNNSGNTERIFVKFCTNVMPLLLQTRVYLNFIIR